MNPKSLYLSLLLEIIGFVFFVTMNSYYHMLFFLMLHSVALYIVIDFLTILIYKRFRKRTRAIATFFIITFPTLYFGYFFMLVAVFYLLRRQKIDTYRPPSIPSLEEVITEGVEFSGRKIGEAAFAVIKEGIKNINPSRLELLISYLVSLDSPHTTQLLRNLLYSSEDTARLYAFSSLYKREKKLNEALHFLKEKLNRGDLTPHERAYIYYEIASIYYTFIHYHIVDSEFRSYTAKEAIDSIKKSINIEPTPEALLLLAKIYIEIRDFDGALPLLEMLAKEGKLNPARYLLQLAEINYEMGNYKEVKELFIKHPEINLLLDVDANFVVRFWRGSNGQGG